MISPEGRILACAAGLRAGCQEEDRLRRLMAGRVDGNRLIAVAVKEGLPGFSIGVSKGQGSWRPSGRTESSPPLPLLPDPHLERRTHPRARGHPGAYQSERIPVVLLQGIALLRDVYTDPGLRPTTDIDLWVLPADLSSATSILVHAGYDSDPLYPTTFRRAERSSISKPTSSGRSAFGCGSVWSGERRRKSFRTRGSSI